MIIEKGVLLSVNASDLDTDGVLHIPNSVSRIKEDVGNNLEGLKEIYLPDSITELTTPVFNNNPLLHTIYFGKDIKNINCDPFNHCPNLNTIQIPTSWESLTPWVDILFANLKTIIRYDTNNNQQKYNVKKYAGIYYYTSESRQIGSVTISKIFRPNFRKTLMPTTQKVLLTLHNKSKNFFISTNLSLAIRECRVYFLIQEFERIIWKYKATHKTDKNFEKCESVLRQSIKNYIHNPDTKLTKENVAAFRNHLTNLPIYIKHMQKFFKKYKNTEDYFEELTNIPFEKLLIKILPNSQHNKKLNKSCTRWLKRHPVTINEMQSIVNAGYKNPGAFPYTWLKQIPKNKRGKATIKLHGLFKKATTVLYSPDNPKLMPYINTETLNTLADNISKIIHQKIDIKYLDSGNFSKTYTLQIPGDKIYVWKIYHCDRNDAIVNSYHHDTELQNSFLVGGKKYFGKTKFRNISTAGISNQRGEMYLIYPYTDIEPVRQRIYLPFEKTRKYYLIDNNRENFLGNTIIDVGGLRINYETWQQPKHVLKISNTILYQSWNDLLYVLNNYSSSQITDALNFLNGKTPINSIESSAIQSKIRFLRERMKTR